MSIGQRVFLVVSSILVLALLYSRFAASAVGIPEEVVVLIFVSLAAGSFSMLLAEHWFTSPSDGVINSLSVLLAMLPAYPSLSALGVWYYILVGFALTILIISASSLVLMSMSPNEGTRASEIARWIKDFVGVAGKAKVLYVLLAVTAMLSYLDSQSALFLWLAAYALAVVAIDPRKSLPKLLHAGRESKLIGDIIGVQSRTTFIAKLRDFRPSVRLHDIVEFRVGGDKAETRKGIIIDNWVLNSQQWVKILSGKDINNSIGRDRVNENVYKNSVHLIETTEAQQLLDRFVGTVCEGSDILSVKFDCAGRKKVSEGALLEIMVDDRPRPASAADLSGGTSSRGCL